MYILAANAQWDDENRFDSIISDFLIHITDEKPITARQCIKALAQVGLAKPHYIPRILSCLREADLSKYKDSMRPLIEKDMAETEKILMACGLEGDIKMKIETERLVITEFDLSMAEDVHKNSLDEDTRRFVPDEVFETVEEAKETIEF